jgi:hypothetical protein
MNSSNTKVLAGCTILVATPLLLIALIVGGLWLKAFNDARAERHLTVWGAVQKWSAESKAQDAGLTPQQRQRLENNRIAWLAVGPIFLLGVVGYIVPSAVAILRKHPQTVAIVALNVLLGWSLVGWVGALVWALVVTDADRCPTPDLRR